MKTNKLHELLAQVDDWRENYHTNKKGEVVFQNKQLYSNVKFTNMSLHEIQKHPRGFELIPEAIENPDEIWSFWEDPKKQIVTMRNYIKLGYVIQTKDGVIIDAFAVPNSKMDRFRKGLPLN